MLAEVLGCRDLDLLGGRAFEGNGDHALLKYGFDCSALMAALMTEGPLLWAWLLLCLLDQ